jgi:hypothetical protein
MSDIINVIKFIFCLHFGAVLYKLFNFFVFVLLVLLMLPVCTLFSIWSLCKFGCGLILTKSDAFPGYVGFSC